MKAPTLVAHRGDSHRYPENTLAALQSAMLHGARWVEFDLQLSADGVPVLFHDKDLRRTAGRDESIFDLEATELSRIAAGEPRRFGDRFRRERIPTLAQAATLLEAWPDRRAFVELKPESLERFGVTPMLERVCEDLGDIARRCVPISFSAETLVAESGAFAKRGWILRAFDEPHRLRAEELAPNYLFINRRRLPPVFELWPGPWCWVVYAVDEAEAALAMGRLGFRFVETNRIGELLADLRFGLDREPEEEP